MLVIFVTFRKVFLPIRGKGQILLFSFQEYCVGNRRAFYRYLSLVLPLAGAAGCWQNRPFHVDSAAILPSVVSTTPSQAAAPQPSITGPLTEEQLIALAVSRHPALAAAQAKIESAQGKVIQAQAYPNPKLGWSGEDMAYKGPDAAGKQGPTLTQEIVTHGKRQWAEASAQQAMLATGQQARTQYHETVKRVRQAYYELLAAHMDLQVNADGEQLARDAVRIQDERLKAGVGTQADVLRVRLELQQIQQRGQTLQQRVATSRRLLALAINQPELSVTVVGNLRKPPPIYQEEAVLNAVMANSSEVREADAALQQAAAEVQLAQAQVYGNLEVSTYTYYNYRDRLGQIDVGINMPLPFFHQNQGNIRAARADWLRAVHQAEATKLKLKERVAQAFQRYVNARRVAEKNESEVLPTAREFQRQVQTGYEKGDNRFDASAVLDAQRTLVQTRSAQVQTLADLWQAICELDALMQQEPGSPAP